MSKISQISIFLNNVPGSISKMADVLKKCNINVIAFNLAENPEFGVFRIIVKDPQAAFAALSEENIVARMTDVIGVRMKDVPGAINPAAKILGDAGINIRYAYAFTLSGGDAVLFIRVDDPDKAVGVLEQAGIPLEKESDLRWQI